VTSDISFIQYHIINCAMSNLKVPLEALSHQFRRTQKTLSRDVNAINEQLSPPSNDSSAEADVDQLCKHIDSLIELTESSDRIEKLQLAKLEVRMKEESGNAQVCTSS
jgi:hypothetical protein